MQLFEGLSRILFRHVTREFLGLADPAAKDTRGLVGELLLVRAGADDQLHQGKDEAGNQGASGLLLDENIDQVEHAVLEVRRLSLCVDICRQEGQSHVSNERSSRVDAKALAFSALLLSGTSFKGRGELLVESEHLLIIHELFLRFGIRVARRR